MMFDGVRNAASEAALKTRVWMRERKERAAERKAGRVKAVPYGAAPLLWCWFLTIIGVLCLAGSTWFLLVFIAGSVGHVDGAVSWRSGNDGVPPHWSWFAVADNVHVLVAIGLGCFCLGIAGFNSAWLHFQKYFYGNFLRLIRVFGVAIGLFMVAGGFVVQQWGTDERSRDEVVAAQTSVANVAAVDSEIAAINQRWAILCAPTLSTWQAQACRSGAQGWQDRISIARGQYRSGDPTLAIIERAIADAREGDRMQSRLTELRRERAAASVQVVHATAQPSISGWAEQTKQFLEDVRKPATAIFGEMLAMTMFSFALGAWATRRNSIERSGWAPEDHRIEDHTADDPIAPQPMKPHREVVTDAETGEELIKVTPKAHWRKRKGQKQKVEFTPEIPPDERGVKVDGAELSRIASVGAEVSPVPPGLEKHPEAEAAEETDQQKGEDGLVDDAEAGHPEPSEITEEAAAELLGLTPTEVTPEVAENSAQDDDVSGDERPHDDNNVDDADGIVSHDDPLDQGIAAEFEQATANAQQQRQPQTDPRRLLAAAE